jgi:glycosyltransferase involved in cell wall biosynthesis
MISIVCPVYNEEKYIGDLLDFYEKINPQEKEIFIIDGQSTDRTRKIVSNYASLNPGVYLLENQKRYVPFALNMAIPLCKGEVIVRWDAHTKYAPDYLVQIIEVFKKTDADIVGGPMRAIGESAFQRAVACATSTPFGVGNSKFHFDQYRGYTDSVYLGAWKRSVFEKIGMFDEQMLRNQDDEFHYRAKRAGLRIFQEPEIRSFYYPRSTIKGLIKQYYGYGLFKPLVLKKIKSEWKLRHVIPMLFASYLILLPLVAWVYPVSVLPLIAYVLLALFFATKIRFGCKEKAWSLLVYPTLHLAYGIGFWKGLFKLKT